MARLTIFAKANLDVRDTLHSLRLNGKVVWNGINEVVRERFPGTLVRLRHETCERSDLLRSADGVVPDDLAGRSLPLGAHPPAAQFSDALYAGEADALVLSIQPEIMTRLMTHRSLDYAFCAFDAGAWRAEDRAWLKSAFVEGPLLTPEESMDHLAAVIERVRRASDAPILIYNMSSIVPGEGVHCHLGLENLLSTRIKAFNLALIGLSQRTGISIIDVDAIIARAGADRMKFDTQHLTPEACRLVAEEVVRVLEDLDLLSP